MRLFSRTPKVPKAPEPSPAPKKTEEVDQIRIDGVWVPRDRTLRAQPKYQAMLKEARAREEAKYVPLQDQYADPPDLPMREKIRINGVWVPRDWDLRAHPKYQKELQAAWQREEAAWAAAMKKAYAEATPAPPDRPMAAKLQAAGTEKPISSNRPPARKLQSAMAQPKAYPVRLKTVRFVLPTR